MQGLLRHHCQFSGLELGQGTQQPLLQLQLHVGFDAFHIRARRDAADHVQPVLLREVEDTAGSIYQWFVRQRNPKCRRVLQAVAEESRRSNSDDCEGLAIQGEASANH